jgi:hypothetical protein
LACFVTVLQRGTCLALLILTTAMGTHAEAQSADLISDEVSEEERVENEDDTLTHEEVAFASSCGESLSEDVRASAITGDGEEELTIPGDIAVTILCDYFTFYVHVGCITSCSFAFPDDPTWPKKKRFRENLRRNVCVQICRSKAHRHFPACPMPGVVSNAE